VIYPYQFCGDDNNFVHVLAFRGKFSFTFLEEK
jgi:hypothetical protein